ncbi:MAG: hypothetical protein AAFS07_16155 [Pseudomonadota bacterium]
MGRWRDILLAAMAGLCVAGAYVVNLLFRDDRLKQHDRVAEGLSLPPSDLELLREAAAGISHVITATAFLMTVLAWVFGFLFARAWYGYAREKRS